ncbi:hypothetical protein DID78_00405 [Candidatus Marinamargulisbacteria bacterium SCGC AG-343-D04]|nr:hypothetical protein DID78_00405 [Candidatus Marinamargulisbacteria bacterium SCGC AG-343-D04]
MKKETLLILGLIILVSLFRFIPHPPNMTPVIAISILSVAYFNKKYLQWGLPLLIMVITDVFLGFHALIPFVYGAILLAGLGGHILRKKYSFINSLGVSFLGSIIFFLVSNFGVWLVGDMYPKTMTGIISCYVAAIPFFHNTLISTLAVLSGVVLLNMFVERTLKSSASDLAKDNSY